MARGRHAATTRNAMRSRWLLGWGGLTRFLRSCASCLFDVEPGGAAPLLAPARLERSAKGLRKGFNSDGRVCKADLHRWGCWGTSAGTVQCLRQLQHHLHHTAGTCKSWIGEVRLVRMGCNSDRRLCKSDLHRWGRRGKSAGPVQLIVNRWFDTVPQTFKYTTVVPSATYRVRGRFLGAVHSRHGRLGHLLLGFKRLPSQFRHRVW
jgi:hypothetical protein